MKGSVRHQRSFDFAKDSDEAGNADYAAFAKKNELAEDAAFAKKNELAEDAAFAKKNELAEDAKETKPAVDAKETESAEDAATASDHQVRSVSNRPLRVHRLLYLWQGCGFLLQTGRLQAMKG